ncbi:TPA: entry exclusion protein 1 [Yersinia enterocolitica]|nr:entry exclusion protein 1 [Yersinia enterocolitica]
MAWHSINESQKLVGKSRRTIYRDMASGLVSWRVSYSGSREIETSELIRVYGDVSLPVTPVCHTVSHDNGTKEYEILLSEIRQLRAEVSELKQTILMIEYKPVGHDDFESKELKKKWWQKIFG